MKFKKIIFLVLVFGCVMAIPGPNDLQELASMVKQPLCIVIDPGHGGPDGGAEAADGTKEKDLNLLIAKALQTEAKKYGMKTVLTRELDEGLYEAENTEKVWKKIGDLKERKRIIEETEADVVVSIHLNSFWPDTSVHGAQVFYPKNGDENAVATSMELASLIQKSLIEGMNDGSRRIEMEKDDIYIFKDVKQPVVLVECGFLSNTEDAKNLQSKAYQKKIAQCIMEAIAEKLNITVL